MCDDDDDDDDDDDMRNDLKCAVGTLSLRVIVMVLI